MDPGDADREELAERVEQLEETVSKMLPGRREVLKGLGAAAVGGAAVGASTGGASGQSAAGQVGTSSSPVDVEAANVNAGSVNTDFTDSTHPISISDTETDDAPAEGDVRNLSTSAVYGSDIPTICWVFDDGYVNVYENRSVFVDENVPACSAFPTNLAGSEVGTNDERMTWEQIQELAFEQNWEILSHGFNELNMDNSTREEIQNEIYAAMSDFLEHGIRPRSHVFVGGATGPNEEGRKYASHLYGASWGINGGPIDGDDVDPFELPRFNTDNQTPIADIKSEIDTAISNGTSLCLNGHRIIDGTVSDENTSGDLETSTGKIQEIIDYVKSSAAQWGTALDVIRESTFPIQYENGSGSSMKIQPNGDVDTQIASGQRVDWVNSNGERVFSVKENGNVGIGDNAVFNVDGIALFLPPKDVRSIQSVFRGYESYHDGSGANTEGPAFYNGSAWISQVDGSTIS